MTDAISQAIDLLRNDRNALFESSTINDDPATLDDEVAAEIARYDEVIAALEALGAEPQP
jgi:hypothetical protein